ncbi:MAG: 50S ribosomal protein L18 [Proteobacteria bacterium]|nr:50S ribosomal protein L18 [Pseudomonadota bacterium]
MAMKLTGRERRKRRIRKNVFGTADRPRLSVFRSLRHIGAQVIDDTAGTTLCAASTCEKGLAGGGKTGNRAAAKLVGEAIAERAKAKGVEKVVFDRNGSIFHGRVKELADAARQKGLKF